MVAIRLVQRNGKLIHLDATDIEFKFARGAAVIPIPVFGERAAADLNSVSCSISMNVVLQDDDCTALDVVEKASTSFIDFAKPNVRDNNTIGAGSYFLGDGGDVTIGQSTGKDITDKEFQLKSTFLKQSSANPIIIKFIVDAAGSLGAATYSSGTVSINLHHANLIHVSTPAPSSGSFTSIAHEVATYLTNALNNAANIGITTTSTGSTGLSHAFTATLNAGTYPTLGNTRVDIVQDEVGINGDSATPVFWDMTSSGSTNTLAVVPPSYQTFRGGSNNSCKSAGDKVQDLIANVSNSNVMGAVGQLFSLDANESRKSVLTKDINYLDPTAGATDDYIVGIQIPYNSLIQSTGTTTMTARNFLVVTGLSPATNQGAIANTLPASTEFDSHNVYTGIRGTVTTFGAKYLAGDTFYSGSIEFKPIDFIAGP